MLAAMRFLFDYISPYAYLAWTQVHALAARHGREVEPVPLLFAGLLEAHGTLGPAEIPAKRRWLFRDIHRTANRLGIPLQPPPAHPFNPLLALRSSAMDMAPGQRKALIDGLYTAVWATSEGVTDPAVVARIASAAGLDGEALVARAGEPEAKQRIKRNTDEAIARGVFGVPTIDADGELFWGFDSFANLDAFLGGAGGIDPDLERRWEALPVASARKS